MFQESAIGAGGATTALRRDVRIIGFVCAAHGLSHFFQLTLPPLFPVLRDEFGVGYAALGLMMSLFYAVSGISQTACGFLVDRVGPRPVLVSGLALLAGAIALAGLSPSYSLLVPIMMLAGVGNSVFHPADYAVFNASVTPRRLGRAYSAHTISGNLGWVLAPVAVVGISALAGWRAALVTLGAIGVAAALVLASQRDALPGRVAASGGRAGASSSRAGSVQVLLSPPVVAAFGYFALLAAALIGVKTFSVSTLVAIYDTPLGLATSALTGYLLGNSSGVLFGGWLADRIIRHDAVAGTGLAMAATLTLMLASGAMPVAMLLPTMVLTGFSMGVTTPSRDMLVRAATPPGASGKVYGFVYSGLDLGSCLTPLLMGWLLDRGEPRTVFLAAAGFMLLTIVPVVLVRRHGVAAAAARASWTGR